MKKHNNIELLKQEIEKKEKKYHVSPIEYTSVIQEFHFFSENDILIQNKLKEIPFFHYHFYCFEKHHFLAIQEVNEEKMEKKEIKKKYLLFRYKKERKVYLEDYFSRYSLLSNSLLTKNTYIRNLIQLYEKMLQTLIKMNKSGICYFNWKKDNIFMNEKDYPILENFDKSIDFSSINEEYISKLCKVEKELKYMPLESIILCFTIKYEYNSLSIGILEDLFIKLKKQLSSLQYEEFISLFQPFINLSKKDIINKLMNSINTWDNYGLSILFTDYVEDLIKKNRFETKFPFLPKWLLILKKNADINPKKRENLEKTLELFKDLFIGS